MKCEKVQEIVSSFIDGELVQDVDKAFSHIFSCEDCQRFLTVSLRFKVEASEDTIEFPEEKKFEIVKRESFKLKLKRAFGVEVPIPAPLLSAVVFMLFMLSFLLSIFIYDKAVSINASRTEIPVYREKTKTVVVYAMPQVTIYPETQSK